VLELDFGFINEHDWQVVPNRINAMALLTLQALRALAVLELRLASRTDQHFEKVFGQHGFRNYTVRTQAASLNMP
jgi:hypothetical protein